MKYQVNNDGCHCQIAMDGQFIFSDNHDFRGIMELLSEDTKSITLDLKAVSFVDSAALGMLLLLRDWAGKQGTALTLAHPQGQVRKLFSVSRFEDLFAIVE